MSVARCAPPRPLILLALLLSLEGCRSTSSSTTASPQAGTATGVRVLIVENRNGADARVYIVRTGLRVRVGTVEAHHRRTFSLARSYLGQEAEFGLEVELLASRERYRTEAVLAMPGDRIDLWIGPRLSLSRLMVRR